MPPLAIALNIAIVVGIIGIIVYWIRRFAVYRGYKAIEADVQEIAAALKTEARRKGSEIEVAGYYGRFPTIVRFSHKLDRPGLHLEMRGPATFNLSVMPKSASLTGAGRVLMRTGSAQLDKKFNARSDQPLEARIAIGSGTGLRGLEQLCCSSQTGFSIKERRLELTELTIPDFAAKHVMGHLESMAAVAKRLEDMPGASEIKVKPLPPQRSSWTIRLTLTAGLTSLLLLLFLQPYGEPSANTPSPPLALGVLPVDAVRIQRLKGWHVVTADEFSTSAAAFLRDHNLPVTGRVAADFTGSGGTPDSAYFLLDSNGQRRVSMVARGVVAYDAIFPRLDLLVRVPKSKLATIQWSAAPQYAADGDALLVIQDANDRTASLVLLRHGTQTYSGQPADFTRIDLASE